MNQQSAWVRTPRQPDAHIQYAHKLGRGALTFQQIEELVKAINPKYVAQKNKMSYLAQHQARAEMNRIFGYGNWDTEVITMRCDYEERLTNDDPRWPKDRGGTKRVSGSGAYWVVGYEGGVRITIRDLWGMPIATYLEHHFEESAPQPNRGEARALALTSVESYALRRSLINLGDRFGLGLYDGGSMAPHGQYTIQLEQGNLFDWKQADGAPSQAAPVVQPTHETIQANQAHPDISDEPSDYDDGSPEQAQAQRQKSRTMQGFQKAAGQVQGMNMQARLQAGMKLDEDAVPPDVMTTQQYAQDES